MKLLNEIAESILKQAVEAELSASNLYKHLSNQCLNLSLFGASAYFKKEGNDETEHYQKLADYFNERGSVAEIPDIDAPDVSVTDLEDALQAALDAEIELGGKYTKWFTTLLPVDPTTALFLSEFIEKQRVSIGFYMDYIKRLSLVADDKCGMLMIDKELGDK